MHIADPATGRLASVTEDGLAVASDLQSDRSGSDILDASNTPVVADVAGAGTVSFTVTGVWAGTIVFEAADESGIFNAVIGYSTYTAGIAATLTANGTLIFPCGGFSQVRARFFAYTSGGAVVSWNAGAGLGVLPVFSVNPNTFQAQVQGTAADGAAPSGNPVQCGGVDDSGITRSVLLTPSGAARVSYANVPTYGASTNGVVSSGTVLATVSSVAYLFHAAANTKTFRILRILASIGGGSGGALNLRGALITAENGTPGGTVQAVNPVNRGDAASTATGANGVFRTGATGAPTRIAGDLMTYSIGGADTGSDVELFDASQFGEPITLRGGFAEGFEIRSVVGTALLTAAQIAVTFFFTESLA